MTPFQSVVKIEDYSEMTRLQNSIRSLRPVLAAEDDEGDATLLRLAFKRLKVSSPLVIVHDGQEAIDYLNGEGIYADRSKHPLPSVLLVDLKMPRLSGFDVLAWCGARPELRALPIVVMSSSSHETDMSKALRLGARDYVVKPHGFSQLTRLVQALGQRWFSEVLIST